MSDTINRNHRMIQTEVTRLDLYTLRGPIENAVARLEQVRVAHHGHKVVLDVYVDADDMPHVRCVVERLETDGERDARVKGQEERTAAMARIRENSERALFTQLKAKYEGAQP